MRKNKGWLLILMSVFITCSTCAQRPVLSYPGPAIYQPGQKVSLAPSSSGVAAFGYSSKTTPWGSGYKDVWGVGVDKAGNVYAQDLQSGIIKIPAGNGQPVILNGYSNSAVRFTVDAAGDVFAISYEDNGDPDGPTLADLWELPAGGKPVVLETVEADFGAPYLAADPAGNLFIAVTSGGYPQNWSLSELPAGSSSFYPVNTSGVSIWGPLVCDASGDLFIAAALGGLTELPAGNGAIINIANPYFFPQGITFDAAGNLYLLNYSNGQFLFQMVPAGNLSAQPVTLGTSFSGASGIAIDGAGNIYRSYFGNAVQPPGVVQVKPIGGYFITPALPAGLHFNSNTGIISGTPTVASPPTNYTVTAYNSSGATSTTFSIKVEKDRSNLSNISLDAGTLSPAFNPDSVNYIAVEGSSQKGIFVTPTAFDATSWIKVNRQGGVKSGSPVFVPLNTGSNTISIVITGHDGTTKTYTINAIRGPYNDDLSELHPNQGYLNQNFMPSVTHYTDSVNYNHTSISVTPVTVDPSATIKVNGITVASGSASPAILLKEGPNIIATVVTAGNGVTTKTFTIVVTRGYSSDASLSEMHPNAGHLNQYFTPAITSYTDMVVNAQRTVNITPVAQDSLATIKVNGIAVASGTASQIITLPVGNTIINTVVTAPDGLTIKTYTITAHRPGNANDNLWGIGLSAGIVSPVFAATTTAYTANVAVETQSIRVTPFAADPDESIKVNGTTIASGVTSAPIALLGGSSIINIDVKSSDGTAVKTYTITVNRPVSTNDNLSSIKLSLGTLSPAFSAATTSYTVNVVNGVTSTTVTPTASEAHATIKVNGTAVASGSPSASIPIPVGSSTINIAVTASDGTTTQTYSITVNRPASNNDNLSSLRISAGLLNQGITANSYTVSVPNNITSMKVTPTAADADATIAVDGASVPSGSASGPIALSVGTTTINIVVTASDGITSQTYTLTVTRWPPFANDDLKAIFLSVGYLSPVFDPATTSYTISLMNSTAGVQIRALAADSMSTVVANGRSPTRSGDFFFQLALGSNTINVVVTSADGTASKTYTINVIRPPSNNANLLSLKISSGTLSPTFTSAHNSYTASVGVGISSVTITPTAAAGATITVNGTAVTSGSASGDIPLNLGSTNITTVVTAQDGTTTNTYTIVFNHSVGLVNIPDESLSVDQPAVSPPIEDDVILVHQGISPNGDGINDFLVIDGILAYPDNKLSIMNRNGQLVFETKGYDNSNKIFDGHSNKTGQMQLPGTYFYQLEYTVKGVTKHKTGYLVMKY